MLTTVVFRFAEAAWVNERRDQFAFMNSCSTMYVPLRTLRIARFHNKPRRRNLWVTDTLKSARIVAVEEVPWGRRQTHTDQSLHAFLSPLIVGVLRTLANGGGGARSRAAGWYSIPARQELLRCYGNA